MLKRDKRSKERKRGRHALQILGQPGGRARPVAHLGPELVGPVNDLTGARWVERFARVVWHGLLLNQRGDDLVSFIAEVAWLHILCLFDYNPGMLCSAKCTTYDVRMSATHSIRCMTLIPGTIVRVEYT